MAKSTNHTAHNQSRKWHRNGIRKPKRRRYMSLKGVIFTTYFIEYFQVNAKFLRNRRRAMMFDPTVKKSKNLSRKIEALKKKANK